jgi:hypothetical protein
MKTDYTKIDELVKTLESNRTEHNRRASLQVGVISGGVDLTESGAEIERNIAELQTMIRSAVAGGCRGGALLSHLSDLMGDRFTYGHAVELLDEREYLKSFPS